MSEERNKNLSKDQSSNVKVHNENILSNWPNRLIILRFIIAFIMFWFLIFIPLSINNGNYVVIFNSKISYLSFVALGLFLLASFTDWLDGYLARKNNQITNFGKFFDPIADKILINMVLIFFAAYAYIPIWVVVVFITRDILVNGLRMLLSLKNVTLAADKYGKMKTIFQMLGISIIFLIHPEPIINDFGLVYNYDSWLQVGTFPLYLGLYFSIHSCVNYYFKNWRFIVKT